MGIGTNGLFTDSPRSLGEVPLNEADGGYIRTAAAEDEILFGFAVMRGTEDIDGKTFAGAGAEFIGVAMRSNEGKLTGDDGVINGYKAGDVLAVKDRGFVVVYVEEAVSPSDPVRVRHTADGDDKPAGGFATTADAGKTTLLKGARFASTTTGAGLVALELGGLTEFETTDD